jgi:arabinose-5-phosphate isomerase
MMINLLEQENLVQENLDKNCALRTINSEIDTIKKLRDSLDNTLTKALDIMQNTKGRIIITGMGKSGHIGKKIAASLASTGTPSFFVHPAEASHGDLGMITEDDTVIAISNSGESRELVDILNYCKRFGIKLIAITKNSESSLGKAGDIVLELPNNGEACPLGLAPTNSTTATLVLGDILTSGLIERKGFTKSDFNQRHPGGKLGSILQRVSDLMHVGSEMPILEENSNMQQVLLEMTSKRLGCVGFVNTLGEFTGMLTDGDLRRCLSTEILNKKAVELMTKNPKTVTKDVMASEAIKIMHDKKITNIFIVKDKKPIGVIHIHDLLNNGVV